MKIAVISDIHSNFNALKEVIYAINKSDCDFKICLGDMVGYYDKPHEVIECLKYYDFKCIKGNHDRYMTGEIKYNIKNKDIYGIERQRKLLSSEDILFLKNCTDYFEFQYKNKKYCFCHSLKDDCEVYLKDENDILNRFNDIEKYDYYFYGHTHRKKYFNIKNHVIINPGSVGQQRDRSFKPSFCIMDVGREEWKIISAEYDIKKYVCSLIKKGYDKRLTDIFTRKEDYNQAF